MIGSVFVADTGPFPHRVFANLSAAISALDFQTTAVQTLFLEPRIYREQVYVPPLRGPLVIQGFTCDTRTYHDNTVTLRHRLSLAELQAADAIGATDVTADDDHTATLRLWTVAGLRVYNINVDNAFAPHPPSGGQALAVSASPLLSSLSSFSSSQSGGQALYACQFSGYQDTLMADTGTQLYLGCRIRGAVDFVFGRTARAWLERCDVRVVAPGFITASGRASADSLSWFVVNNSTVDVDEEIDSDDDDNNSTLLHQTYLGRPWAEYARVVFQRTYLGDVVHPAGWSVWGKTAGNSHTAHVQLGEFGNYGPDGSPVDTSQRATFARQLAAPVDIVTVLGASWASAWWVDGDYLV